MQVPGHISSMRIKLVVTLARSGSIGSSSVGIMVNKISTIILLDSDPPRLRPREILNKKEWNSTLGPSNLMKFKSLKIKTVSYMGILKF